MDGHVDLVQKFLVGKRLSSLRHGSNKQRINFQSLGIGQVQVLQKYTYIACMSICIYHIHVYVCIYKTPTSSPYAQSIYNLCSLCKIKGSGICHISKLGVQESTWKGHSVSSLLPLENSTMFLVAPWRSPFCQLPSQASFSLATTEWIGSYANSSPKKKKWWVQHAKWSYESIPLVTLLPKVRVAPWTDSRLWFEVVPTSPDLSNLRCHGHSRVTLQVQQSDYTTRWH